MTVVLVVGSTRTATIEGISAAGATRELMAHTPAADAEIVAFGRPVLAPVTPVSPTGCPTPAVVTRAVRELVGYDLLVVDAGLAARTAAPSVDIGEGPGGDIRDPEPVPAAEAVFERARELGRELPAEDLLVGESIPGGTTTALGVLRALGEPHAVSSSLAANPVERKRAVVATALDASGLHEGEAEGDPLRAIRLAGDPVLAAVVGVVVGSVETGVAVTLAGGTQLLAAAAAVRHLGVSDRLPLATTTFIENDEHVDLRTAAEDLSLDLRVTDPRFDRADHPALERYRRGEGKEGVGMGGALMLAERDGVPMGEVRSRIVGLYESVVDGDGP